MKNLKTDRRPADLKRARAKQEEAAGAAEDPLASSPPESTFASETFRRHLGEADEDASSGHVPPEQLLDGYDLDADIDRMEWAMANHREGRPRLHVVSKVPPANSGVSPDVISLARTGAELFGDAADFDAAQRALTRQFPWAEAQIQQILQRPRLARRMGQLHIRIPPILLVGAPGSGKTSFARALGHEFELAVATLSVAGSADNRLLAGTARGWSSATPCFPLQVIARHNSANPLIIIDELDKAGGGEKNGDVRQTLLAMTERASAEHYLDECLGIEVNLSMVSWIATANRVTDSLCGPLLSRFSVIEWPSPRGRDFDAIIVGMLREMAGDLDLSSIEMLPRIEPEAMAVLRRQFTRGWPMRKIRAALEAAMSIAAEAAAARMH